MKKSTFFGTFPFGPWLKMALTGSFPEDATAHRVPSWFGSYRHMKDLAGVWALCDALAGASLACAVVFDLPLGHPLPMTISGNTGPRE